MKIVFLVTVESIFRWNGALLSYYSVSASNSVPSNTTRISTSISNVTRTTTS